MAAFGRTRILIVDDSAVMRSLLRAVLSTDADMEVAGSAADGESALRTIDIVRPDLVLLDVEMPVKDGLTTLRQLRAQGYKMPVIMCSSLTHRGAKVAIEALADGASDYVTKPTGQSGREAAIHALAHDLLPKIRALTKTSTYEGTLERQRHAAFSVAGRLPPTTALTFPLTSPLVSPSRTEPISAIPAVLTIGVSTGGPAALELVLPDLPDNFPLPVMIVQHMPELFTKLFAERLDGRCQLRVREASEGDEVRAGTIYIAKGNWHMEVLAGARARSPATLHLSQGPMESHCRPAVDVLFRSAAGVYGSGVLAVVLTGMGSDGLIGCRMIRERGGSVVAQNQETSAVWGMPGAVVNAGLAHRVLPLNAIIPEVLRICSRMGNPTREFGESAVKGCK